jgi:pimeloyl-ACP methyl ester carboxylesterase
MNESNLSTPIALSDRRYWPRVSALPKRSRQRDQYLGPELAELDHDDVPNLERVERLPDASHWVHHDEAKQVNQLLIDFFAPAVPTENRWKSMR